MSELVGNPKDRFSSIAAHIGLFSYVAGLTQLGHFPKYAMIFLSHNPLTFECHLKKLADPSRGFLALSGENSECFCLYMHGDC